MIHRCLLALCLLAISTAAQAQECIVSGGYLDCGRKGFGTIVDGKVYMNPRPPQQPANDPLQDWADKTFSRPTCPAGYVCTKKP